MAGNEIPQTDVTAFSTGSDAGSQSAERGCGRYKGRNASTWYQWPARDRTFHQAVWSTAVAGQREGTRSMWRRRSRREWVTVVQDTSAVFNASSEPFVHSSIQASLTRNHIVLTCDTIHRYISHRQIEDDDEDGPRGGGEHTA